MGERGSEQIVGRVFQQCLISEGQVANAIVRCPTFLTMYLRGSFFVAHESRQNLLMAFFTKSLFWVVVGSPLRSSYAALKSKLLTLRSSLANTVSRSGPGVVFAYCAKSKKKERCDSEPNRVLMRLKKRLGPMLGHMEQQCWVCVVGFLH